MSKKCFKQLVLKIDSKIVDENVDFIFDHKVTQKFWHSTVDKIENCQNRFYYADIMTAYNTTICIGEGHTSIGENNCNFNYAVYHIPYLVNYFKLWY